MCWTRGLRLISLRYRVRYSKLRKHRPIWKLKLKWVMTVSEMQHSSKKAQKNKVNFVKDLERTTAQIGEAINWTTVTRTLHKAGLHGRVVNHLKSCLEFARRHCGHKHCGNISLVGVGQNTFRVWRKALFVFSGHLTLLITMRTPPSPRNMIASCSELPLVSWLLL